MARTFELMEEHMPAPSGKPIALGGPSVFEIRTYTAAEGKLDALHARFRGAHSGALQEARHDERRLVQAAGRAAQAEHAHLHPGASQPRGCGEELARVSNRSWMAEGERGVRNARRPYDEDRVRLCRSNRLLTDEVIRCAIATEHGDSL